MVIVLGPEKLKEILSLKFFSSDLGTKLTVKEFLIKLLSTLWEEEEGFSGKRPFGNSGWKSELFVCLVDNKIIPGKIIRDADGNIEDFAYNREDAEKVILEVIKNL
jgi:hypothetical protein